MRVLLILIAATALALGACGKKGGPKAPSETAAEAAAEEKKKQQ